MKSISVLFAAGNIGHKFERVFDGLSAFEKSLEWACSVKSSLKTVVLTDLKNYPLVEDSLSSFLKDRKDLSKDLFKIVQNEDWTNSMVAKSIAEETAVLKADFAVFAWADTPFLNKALTEELIKNHVEYKAEYSFADGFSYGLTCEVVDKGVAAIIAELSKESLKATGDKKAERTALFSIMSGDINSFEIETLIADKDYRMLRLNLEASSKTGLFLCKTLYELAKDNSVNLKNGDFDAYKLLDLAEASSVMQQGLPSFYNVQISNSYNTKSLYCPYEKIDFQKKLPNMSLDDFKVLVKKISDYSEEAVVSLSLFGEACLNGEFSEFSKEVLKYDGLKLFIETDGLSFTEEDALKIQQAAKSCERVYIALKLDATEPLMYEKINGLSAQYFEKALSCLSMLEKYFKGQVYPQFTRMKANESQLETFFRFWNEKTSPSFGKVLIVKYDSCAGLLSDEKVADLSPLERNACWHLRRDMNILSDNSVILCKSRFQEVVGNALEDDFSGIWEKIRCEVQNHIEKNYCKKCMDCDEFYTFNF